MSALSILNGSNLLLLLRDKEKTNKISIVRRRRQRTTRWFLLTPFGQQNAPFRFSFRLRDFNQNSSSHWLYFRVFLRHFERLPGHRNTGFPSQGASFRWFYYVWFGQQRRGRRKRRGGGCHFDFYEEILEMNADDECNESARKAFWWMSGKK